MTWYAIAGLAVLALVLAAVAAAIILVRRTVGGVRGIHEAHPGVLVLPTGLVDAGNLLPTRRAAVVAVLADRAGLSFRDRSDAEVLLVPAEEIMSLELAPLNPRSRVRPLRVEQVGGAPIAFWAGTTEDQQLASIIALRAALGRPAG